MPLEINEQQPLLPWAPLVRDEVIAYTVRVSTRAKHAHIEVTTEGDVVVVVPRRFSHKRIPAIIEESQDWIHRAKQRMARRRETQPPPRRRVRPRAIILRAIGERWEVEYKPTRRRSITVRERKDRRITVSGAVDNRTLCFTALHRWLGRQAGRHLIPCKIPYGRPAAMSRELLLDH